jgi:hypothetical protein
MGRLDGTVTRLVGILYVDEEGVAPRSAFHFTLRRRKEEQAQKQQDIPQVRPKCTSSGVKIGSQAARSRRGLMFSTLDDLESTPLGPLRLRSGAHLCG